MPIRDENPTRRTAFVNYALITLNIVVFLYTWPRITGGQWWIVPGYGLVPSRLSNDPAGEAFTVFTSMFMHGGWGHLGSNMLFLYIFGDNIEDVLGRLRYLAFYLVSGLVAGLVQLGIDFDSTIPMVGASGAIAGVVGGYLLLFPRAPIVAFNPVPLLWFIMGIFPVIPAWLIAGEFFIVNLMQGVGALQMMDEGAASGGVAVFAHLGGFVAGLVLIRPFMGQRRPQRRVWTGFGPPSSAGSGGPRWRRRPRRTDYDD